MGSEPHRNCSQSWAECMCHLSLPIGFVLVRTGRGIWGILIMIFGPITTTSPKGIIIEQLFYVSEPFSSSMKVKVKSLSRARLLATKWTAGYQASLSMDFPGKSTGVGCHCFIDYAKAFDCVDHNKLWKILQEMGIPDHHTSLLRNLYAGQEATIRTMDWFQIGKGVCQGCILSPCLFNLCAEYITRNAWLD